LGCANGACRAACYSDSDCAIILNNNLVPYCAGNESCIDLQEAKCLNPGTANASCIKNIRRTCTPCEFGCENGNCKTQLRISTCQEINQPGYYILANDLSGPLTPGGACIIITTSDVILDMNKHKISTSINSSGDGIYASGYNIKNLTITNGEISNFATAIALFGVNGSLISNMRFYNGSTTIQLGSTHNIKVKDNLFANNMHSILISYSGKSNEIINNRFTFNNGVSIEFFGGSNDNIILRA